MQGGKILLCTTVFDSRHWFRGQNTRWPCLQDQGICPARESVRVRRQSPILEFWTGSCSETPGHSWKAPAQIFVFYGCQIPFRPCRGVLCSQDGTVGYRTLLGSLPQPGDCAASRDKPHRLHLHPTPADPPVQHRAHSPPEPLRMKYTALL